MSYDIDPAGLNPAKAPAGTSAGCSRWFTLVAAGAGSLSFVAAGIYTLTANWPKQGTVGVALLCVGAAALVTTIAGFINKGRPALADEVGPETDRPVVPVASPSGVDTTALPQSADLSSYRISRPEHHVLAMAPTAHQYAGAGLVFAVAVTFVVPVVIQGHTGWAIVNLLVWAIGFAILRNIVSHRFDRQDEVYRTSALFRRADEIPLRSIRGVQLVTDVPREERWRGRTNRYVNHQLNLVLDVREEPRWSLVEGRDREAIVEFGRLLAGFLAVPLYRDGSS